MLRLLMAGLLAACVGLERELSEETAGLRTHILVGVGSCLFTLMSAYGLVGLTGPTPDLRVAAQIVSGVGFLGAGAILRSGFGVRGLATAASLWLTAGVGMATGLDHWLLAGVSVLIALIALNGARRLESRLLRQARSRVEITAACGPQMDLDALLAAIGKSGALVRGAQIVDERDVRILSMIIEVKRGPRMEAALGVISQVATIQKAEWTI